MFLKDRNHYCLCLYACGALVFWYDCILWTVTQHDSASFTYYFERIFFRYTFISFTICLHQHFVPQFTPNFKRAKYAHCSLCLCTSLKCLYVYVCIISILHWINLYYVTSYAVTTINQAGNHSHKWKSISVKQKI